MVDLDERKSELLELIIRDYISTVRPVASGRLAMDYELEMSPATVRNAMATLDGLGYLAQPHHSAGRVPTIEAYRFFVDRVGERLKVPEASERFSKELSLSRDVFGAAVRIIANRSHNVGLGGWFSRPDSFRFSGLAETLRQPEFEAGALGVGFVAAIEELFVNQKLLYDLIEDIEFDEPRVYIGRENPLKILREWSMVVTRVQDGIVAIIGPTRMSYPENIGLAAWLARAIEKIVE